MTNKGNRSKRIVQVMRKKMNNALQRQSFDDRQYMVEVTSKQKKINNMRGLLELS